MTDCTQPCTVRPAWYPARRIFCWGILSFFSNHPIWDQFYQNVPCRSSPNVKNWLTFCWKWSIWHLFCYRSKDVVTNFSKQGRTNSRPALPRIFHIVSILTMCSYCNWRRSKRRVVQNGWLVRQKGATTVLSYVTRFQFGSNVIGSICCLVCCITNSKSNQWRWSLSRSDSTVFTSDHNTSVYEYIF